jgi:hypothetical protein
VSQAGFNGGLQHAALRHSHRAKQQRVPTPRARSVVWTAAVSCSLRGVPQSSPEMWSSSAWNVEVNSSNLSRPSARA